LIGLVEKVENKKNKYREEMENFKAKFAQYLSKKGTNIYIVDDDKKFKLLKNEYLNIREKAEGSSVPHEFLFVSEPIHKVNVTTTMTKQTSKITVKKLINLLKSSFETIIAETEVSRTKRELQRRRDKDISYLKDNFNDEDIVDYSKDFSRTRRYLYGEGEIKIAKNSLFIVLKNRPVINVIDNRDTRQSVETLIPLPIYLDGYGLKRNEDEILKLKMENALKRKKWEDKILEEMS
jgi:hypothetical protein